MDTSDDDLKAIMDRKRQELGIEPQPAKAAVQVVKVTCRECGQEREITVRYGRPPVALRCSRCVEATRAREAAQRDERIRQAAQAAERERDERLAQVRQELPLVLRQRGVPARLARATFDACPDLPGKLVQAARVWALAPSGIVVLSGSPGAGKSYLAAAILADILHGGRLDPGDVLFMCEADYLAELRQGYGDATPASSKATPGAKVLAFDDLCSTRLTDWGRGELATLLAARHADALPTIITSNLSLSELAVALDARSASRLGEDGQVWIFPQADLRQTPARVDRWLDQARDDSLPIATRHRAFGNAVRVLDGMTYTEATTGATDDRSVQRLRR